MADAQKCDMCNSCQQLAGWFVMGCFSPVSSAPQTAPIVLLCPDCFQLTTTCLTLLHQHITGPGMLDTEAIHKFSGELDRLIEAKTRMEDVN